MRPRTRQTDVTFDSGTVLPSCLVCYWFRQFIKVLCCFEYKTPRIVKRALPFSGKKLTSTDRHCPRKTRGTMAAWPARASSWKLRITSTTQTLGLPSPFVLTLFYLIRFRVKLKSPYSHWQSENLNFSLRLLPSLVRLFSQSEFTYCSKYLFI